MEIFFDTLLTDFLKAFDCLDPKWLTAKMNAYSFNLPALHLIHDYLSNRKQRIKTEKKHIELGWELHLALHAVQ